MSFLSESDRYGRRSHVPFQQFRLYHLPNHLLSDPVHAHAVAYVPRAPTRSVPLIQPLLWPYPDPSTSTSTLDVLR